MTRFIEPHFGPGSGWYRPGRLQPGSHTDLKAMRDAAFPCSVFVLRRLGKRRRARDLLLAGPIEGWLVCLDRYTAPNWYACLFKDQSMTAETMRLLHARLERENGGVRLYGGIEVDAQGRKEHRQSWLCTPDAARGRSILLALADQQGDPL
jgi:hypothetical protein